MHIALSIFDNFFDDKNIIDTRLYNFGNYLLTALNTANGTANIHQEQIDTLSPALTVMFTEISGLDASQTIGLGTTKTNDEVLAAFKTKMSDENKIIAKALGGKNAPALLEFYPHKLSEYTKVTKKTMPFLVNRVSTAAKKYEAKIGKILADELIQFEIDWSNTREQQEVQASAIKTIKIKKSIARVELENAIKSVLLDLSKKFIGQPEAVALQFVNCRLLFPVPKHATKRTFSGETGVNGITVILHESLGVDVEISVKNTNSFASFIIYKGESSTAKAIGIGKQINPGKKAHNFLRNYKLIGQSPFYTNNQPI